MARWWTNLFDKVWDHILVEEPAVKESANLEAPAHMLQAVEQARREWVTARLYFESVTDPDLVDHAIYSIEAAERKYMYLLRQARAQGLAVGPPSLSSPASSPSLLSPLSNSLSGSPSSPPSPGNASLSAAAGSAPSPGEERPADLPAAGGEAGVQGAGPR